MLQLYNTVIQGFFVCLLFKATSPSYGISQLRGRIRVVTDGLHRSHSNALSVTHTTAHGNAGSLTHQIEPVSSWIPVGFVTD